MISFTGISVHEAVKMATLNPAKNLKVNHYIGQIKVGYQADLVVIDKNFNVIKTIKNGNVVFDKNIV